MMFFFLHAKVWSPKETGLERPLNPCSRGLAQLTVKGQALMCLQVSTRNTVFPPSSLCFWLHSSLRIAGVSCSSLLTCRASVSLHIWDCCCALQDICPSSTQASITPSASCLSLSFACTWQERGRTSPAFAQIQCLLQAWHHIDVNNSGKCVSLQDAGPSGIKVC